MPSAVLIIASTRVHADVQEILRIQDTTAALAEQGWAVDLLVPRTSALLSAALTPAVRIFTVPEFPFCGDPPPRASLRRFITGSLMFLRGVALASHRDYAALHGFNDGAIVARAVAGASLRRIPHVAELHLPFAAPGLRRGIRTSMARAMERNAFRRAAAVVLPDEATMECFPARLPKARVALIPDPHTEITPDAFTVGEFAAAVAHVYDYILRPHHDRLFRSQQEQ
jgi:hypothetical protein